MATRGALVLVASVFWTTRALSQTPSPTGAANALELRVIGCSEELTSSLPAVVQLEIDVLQRESGSSRMQPERIAVQCSSGRVVIAVTLAGATAESELDLAPLASDHRARAIALAAAELVHSLSQRSQRSQRSTVATVVPNAKPALASLPPRPSETPPGTREFAKSLVLGGLAEWLGEPSVVLFGARLSLHYPVGRLIAPALSIDGALGGISTSSARVSEKTLGLAAHLYFGTNTGRLRWDAGPGARIALAALSARPDSDSTLVGRNLTAAWGGPELRARVAYGSAAPFAVELGAGVVALPVRGLKDGSERVYAIQGAWFSLCVGLGLGL